MTTTQIGEGTKRLSEWAVGYLWPNREQCMRCNGRGTFWDTIPGASATVGTIIATCQSCRGLGIDTRDSWLRAALESPHDEMQWRVFADYLEDHGDPRAADVRMCARLLPLNKFPDTTGGKVQWNSWNDGSYSSIDGDIIHSIGRPRPGWIQLRIESPDIFSALRILDAALQDRDNALQESR